MGVSVVPQDNRPVERLKQAVLPNGVDLNLEDGFISILVDFPNQEQMQKTIGMADPKTFLNTIVQFVAEMIYSNVPQDIDVTGTTGFDAKRPIRLKRVSFPTIPYEGVEGGKALKVNAWFTQEVNKE